MFCIGVMTKTCDKQDNCSLRFWVLGWFRYSKRHGICRMKVELKWCKGFVRLS